MRRCAEERGFTMLLAMFVLVITTLLLGGAYVAVLDDSALSRNDLDQKRAYAAAQAGIQAYNYNLNQNVNYWESCSSTSNAAVPGSTESGAALETYSTTPVVASTAPSGTMACSTANPLATMIESAAAGPAAGTFRIKSTGKAGGVQRTIVAQYQAPSFLNYVYYTDYETIDPSALPGDPADCAVHYPRRGGDCSGPINFITGDVLNGPLHSEDTIAICGSPVFGRTANDSIEAPALSNEGQGGCSNSPTMTGTYSNSAPSLTPPPSNSQIAAVTQPAYHFTGATTIALNDTSMTVTNANFHAGVATSVPFPTNGVVYVSTTSSGCGVTYTPYTAAYAGDANCGNAYVSGTYSNSLTIATDNNIIINGNIEPTGVTSGAPTGTALLGLIANDFVRIYHPLSGTRGTTSGACNDGNGGANVTNGPGSLTNLTIYAAILAVNHSFIIDNFDCGSPLGTLTMWGAIAQRFRGPVGTGNSSYRNSGYIKNYNYDDRLVPEEPPYFLNPVSAQWYVGRETECDTTC